MIAHAPQDGLEAHQLLGPNGWVACCSADYEYRPQQIAMASKVIEALRQKYILVAEAGTGVGKSFAYLAAALDQAFRKNGRVLISTYTIHLQQQLMEKDIPFLQQAVPQPFTACLAKGRNHYLCLRRLRYAQNRRQALFEDRGSELSILSEWAQKTQDGSLSDLKTSPSPQLWQTVQSEHGICRGRKCPSFRECFYWRARRKLETADIIVANHALLFSDLVLRQSGASILPPYRFVILDEAHNLEHVAEEHFGIELSPSSIRHLLDTLCHPRHHKGLLDSSAAHQKARQLVNQCRREADLFFAQIQAWYEQTAEETGGRCTPDFVSDNLTEPLRQLRLELNRLVKEEENEDQQLEFQRIIDRCQETEQELKIFLSQSQEGFMYWVEEEAGPRKTVVLRSAPLDVGPYVKACLFDVFDSVVLTSATLSSGQSENGFDFFTRRIGLENYQSVQVGSPFDYSRQVRLYLEANMPDPNSEAFQEKAARAIQKYLLKTEGRAFILFTSHTMLRQMAGCLAGWLAEQKMTALIQGEGQDRAALLAQFKTLPRCVLFGTDSFWQGVDVPGEQLSNVIIVRLPFAVPGHPLIQGRIEQIRAQGGNPFYEYQVPMAILKFKQGFGRLIRRKTDQGIVAVLDSRILQKKYGKQFLQALPECPIFIEE
ncbi:MAG TPA: helicase C-terminal domain-containing protein [Anaerohalosphaeraceae bacterium]|nr:helicase C-terminal domain-containing protein [Anaerohalosphaeraceae bacterium]